MIDLACFGELVVQSLLDEYVRIQEILTNFGIDDAVDAKSVEGRAGIQSHLLRNHPILQGRDCDTMFEVILDLIVRDIPRRTHGERSAVNHD